MGLADHLNLTRCNAAREIPMVRFISKFFGATGTRKTATTIPTCRQSKPQVEMLEDRLVPTVTISAGNIIITQTNGDDVATVTRTAINGRVNFNVNDNGKMYHFDARTKNIHGSVIYNGQYGNDRFTNFTALPT